MTMSYLECTQLDVNTDVNSDKEDSIFSDSGSEYVPSNMDSSESQDSEESLEINTINVRTNLLFCILH